MRTNTLRLQRMRASYQTLDVIAERVDRLWNIANYRCRQEFIQGRRVPGYAALCAFAHTHCKQERPQAAALRHRPGSAKETRGGLGKLLRATGALQAREAAAPAGIAPVPQVTRQVVSEGPHSHQVPAFVFALEWQLVCPNPSRRSEGRASHDSRPARDSLSGQAALSGRGPAGRTGV